MGRCSGRVDQFEGVAPAVCRRVPSVLEFESENIYFIRQRQREGDWFAAVVERAGKNTARRNCRVAAFESGGIAHQNKKRVRCKRCSSGKYEINPVSKTNAGE